jgi:hypothetical protein
MCKTLCFCCGGENKFQTTFTTKDNKGKAFATRCNPNTCTRFVIQPRYKAYADRKGSLNAPLICKTCRNVFEWQPSAPIDNTTSTPTATTTTPDFMSAKQLHLLQQQDVKREKESIDIFALKRNKRSCPPKPVEQQPATTIRNGWYGPEDYTPATKKSKPNTTSAAALPEVPPKT